MSLLIPAEYRKVPGKWQAPSWFVTRLHDIDPALDVFFNTNRQRWIIFRNANGTQTHVKTLESSGGGYQAPCESVLDWLKQSDTWMQGETAEQIAAAMSYEEQRQRDKIAASIKADFHDAAMDDKLQIKRAIGSATVFPSVQPSESGTPDASGENTQ
jgi:hypothetical protein